MRNKLHHSVYIIELSKEVLKDKKFMEANPHTNIDDGYKTPLYVGMTGVPIEQRFKNHKQGYKSSRYAHRYGVKLLPKLYQHLNTMGWQEAAKMEKQLAEELRQLGHPVWQR